MTLTVPKGALKRRVKAQVLRGKTQPGGYHYESRIPKDVLDVDSDDEMTSYTIPKSQPVERSK